MAKRRCATGSRAGSARTTRVLIGARAGSRCAALDWYCNARSQILASLVTLRTWTFAISITNTSATVAQGLICPDAQYVAVWRNDGRLDRRKPGNLADAAAGTGNVAAVRLADQHDQRCAGSMGAVMTVAFPDTQIASSRGCASRPRPGDASGPAGLNRAPAATDVQRYDRAHGSRRHRRSLAPLDRPPSSRVRPDRRRVQHRVGHS